MKRAALAIGLVALSLLSACSSGTDDAASTSTSTAGPSASSPSAGSSSGSPSTGSPSASPTETILAVLCDEAAPETVTVIKDAMQPGFSVSQLVDVRTDDAGMHAVLGFVEGPGLAVLAQWTGSGLGLEGLSAADEFAAQATDLPVAGAGNQEITDLLSQTVTCYSSIYASEDGDKKKKGDKGAE